MALAQPRHRKGAAGSPEGSTSGSDLIKHRSATNRIDNNKTSEENREPDFLHPDTSPEPAPQTHVNPDTAQGFLSRADAFQDLVQRRDAKPQVAFHSWAHTPHSLASK